MRQRLFTLAAAGSAVLCVASVTAWARSHYATDALIYGRGHWSTMITSIDGVLELKVARSERPWSPGWTFDHRPPDPTYTLTTNPTLWGEMGFFAYSADYPGIRSRGVAVPFWLLCLSTAILPMAAVRRRLYQKEPPAICRRCGYDLRATPERCPECGAVTGSAIRTAD
jgi:hypothetical protein